MPVPIKCMEATLRHYAGAFRALFSRPQFQHFVTVLPGLLAGPERRTLRGLQRCVPGTHSLSALTPASERGLAEAPWEPGELVRAGLVRFRQQLLPQIQAECERQRIHAFAIFDDSTMAKHVQGEPERCMQGVGCHYSTTLGKVVEGHSLVAGLLVLLGRRCPLVLRLYRQKAVAEAEGAPFQSRVDLVAEAIRDLRPIPGTVTHILVDASLHLPGPRLRPGAGAKR